MRKVKIFLAYFPVALVSIQVLLNLLSFVAGDWYMNNGWYLNTFFGTNIMFSVFMVFFCFAFKFCSISRASSIAELAFGVFYLIIQEDNLYNQLFQITVGITSLVVTVFFYIKKFPFCRISLLYKFGISLLIAKGDCMRGIENFDTKIEQDIVKAKYNGKI